MKIACFADCHVGAYGRKVDPSTGLNSRFLDMIDTIEWIMADSQQRGCEEVLIAGDLFRTSRPTPTELVFTDRALESARPVIVIPGNHDQPRTGNEYSAIEALHGVTAVTTPRIFDRQGYQVVAIPYPQKSWFAATRQGYASMSPEEVDAEMGLHIANVIRNMASIIDPSQPSILLGHLSLDCAELGAERGIMAGRDVTIPIDAIPEELTFAVLGHIHRPQSFEDYGRPNVLYTGSTERIDFGEEGETKSYVILDTKTRSWERIPIPCRDYCTVRAVCDGERIVWEDPENLDVVDTICRVHITRPESVKPDYAALERDVADCWDFRGFVEDVQRSLAVRSEEVMHAKSLDELIGLWCSQTGCELDSAAMVAAAKELERSLQV